MKKSKPQRVQGLLAEHERDMTLLALKYKPPGETATQAEMDARFFGRSDALQVEAAERAARSGVPQLGSPPVFAYLGQPAMANQPRRPVVREIKSGRSARVRSGS